jgi:enoyl-CoA hydratase
MMMARALLIAKQSRRQHRILFDRLLSTSTSSSGTAAASSSSSLTGSLVQWEVVKIPRSTTDEKQQQEQENLTVGILSIGGGANYDDGSGGTPEKGQRPSYNPLTMEMSVELAHASRHPPDNHLDAVIITGVNGSPAFSAGGHYEWLMSLRDQPVHINVDTMLEFYHNVLTVRELPCPVLAALNGPAVGAGAGLALACDLRLAARTTTRLLGLTFTKLGVHTGMGAAHFLLSSHAVPSGVINEILLGGQTLSAEKCYEMGLVNRLVATPQEVRSGALDYCREVLAHTHPVAVRTLMRTLRARQNVGLEEALQRDAYAQAVCYARRDWGEGVTAARDKRPAVFGPYRDK